jgi:mannose-6-phosphate isomerase-like protein (cupin superfamily)
MLAAFFCSCGDGASPRQSSCRDSRPRLSSRAKLGSLSSRQSTFLRLPAAIRHLLRHSRELTFEDSMSKINLDEKFAKITEYWKPYIAAELNGQHVKLDKLKGEFVFHHHENEDEMFLVVKGRFRMEFRDRHEWIEEGEFIVVPRGVEHRPVADEECWLLLFEPAGTLNTGNIKNERTWHELERV